MHGFFNLPRDVRRYCLTYLDRDETMIFRKAAGIPVYIQFDIYFSYWAAKNGHLDVLKWARSEGCPWNSWTCTNAARNGYLDILKWARANGCPWDAWTCAYAANDGHLDVLKWLRSADCPWDTKTYAFAAENGHLDILKWARENGCPE